MKQTKRGFTLAEVLITLAVIGIVAALTIPTLTGNYRKRSYLVGLKKKYAELHQVIRLSTIENGGMSGWDWNLENDEFIARYISPYFKQMNACEDCWLLSRTQIQPKGLFFEQPALAAPDPDSQCFENAMNGAPVDEVYCQPHIDACINAEGNWGSGMAPGVDIMCAQYYQWYITQNAKNIEEEPEITYTLADGGMLGFTIKKTNKILYIYIDVNGQKNPNKYGADKYVFSVINNTISAFGNGEPNPESGEYGCSSEGNRMFCASVIIKNGWEYPDDYPNI